MVRALQNPGSASAIELIRYILTGVKISLPYSKFNSAETFIINILDGLIELWLKFINLKYVIYRLTCPNTRSLAALELPPLRVPCDGTLRKKDTYSFHYIPKFQFYNFVWLLCLTWSSVLYRIFKVCPGSQNILWPGGPNLNSGPHSCKYKVQKLCQPFTKHSDHLVLPPKS